MSSAHRLVAVVAALVTVVGGGVLAGVVVVRDALQAPDPTPAKRVAGTQRLVSSDRPAAPLAATSPRASAGARATVAPSWLARVARRTGVPVRALQAYATASLQLGAEQPGCRLGWPTLAAVGAIESDHGRHGGAALRADGRPTEPIISSAIDGGSAVAAIADTDGGALDGDPTWDRAVGPLQFIPSTWRRWAADGDGDGVADPQDIDDAALAAGRYLCAAGGRLDRGGAWWRAVHTYNDSDDYARDVLDTADSYARASW